MATIEAEPIPRAATPDELVTIHSADVWRFVQAQISHREDAEDIVMETFAAAFRDFRKVTQAENQRHWLLAVARRKVADRHRRKYRRAEEPIANAEGYGITQTPSPDQLNTRDAINRVAPDQREALILKYVNGLSTEEVGQVIRRFLAATNSLLQRGRESLRAALTSHGENV
jgi:RNA polymerase sigma-70 factor (ECF subfamily)